MRLIYNSDAQRLQKDFDDKTPTSVSEMLRAERTSSVPLELFLVDNDGGYATPGTSDYEVVIGRSAQELTTGLLKLTWTGTTEAIDLSKPKLATRIESALNAVAEIDTAGGVDVVGLTNGRGYQITFRSVGSRAAITAGVSESMQPATATLTEVTAGDMTTKEVQLLTLEEASLAEVSTSSWSASSAPALTISTLVAGTSSTREVQKLSISGDPAPGSFFVVSDSEPISTEATAAQVKTILNSALSSDIGSVKKTGEREWQVTYKTNGDKAALSAGTHNLVRRPGISATLSLNTTALAYASNSDGSDLSIGFTLRKSNEVIISEKISLSEPFAEVLGSTAMLTNDSIGALFSIDGDEINKGQAITISGGLTYSSHTLAAPFLPLAGGTMTGDALFGDNIKAKFGTGSDLLVWHDSSNSFIQDVGQGALYIEGSSINLRKYNSAEYFARFISDGAASLFYNGAAKLETTNTGATISGKLIVNGDMDVSGTTTTFNSTTVTVDDPIFTVGGDTAPGSDDNKDRGIEFRYYSGSAKVGFFGYDDSADAFTFLTDATNNSEVFSGTAGNLATGNITTASNSNVIATRKLVARDGNGILITEDSGTTGLSIADSGAATFGGVVLHADGSAAAPSMSFSSSNDTGFYHYGADSIGISTGGSLRGTFESGGKLKLWGGLELDGNTALIKTTLTVGVDDTGHDVKFFGATAGSYMLWDESEDKLILNEASLQIIDATPNIQLYDSDTSNQFNIDFNGADVTFKASTPDGKMIFQADDNSGGLDAYFWLDGGALQTTFVKNLLFYDNVILKIGNDADLQIKHDGSNSYINQTGTGALHIRQTIADQDIFLSADNGSGTATTYFYLDGSEGLNRFTKPIHVGADTDGHDVKFFGNTSGSYMLWDEDANALHFPDVSYLYMGTGADLRMYHNGSDSHIDNYTGNLNIVNNTNNGLVQLYCDDGSNGVTPYITLDGDAVVTKFSKPVEVQGAAGAAGILTLSTAELTVVDGDELGRINFSAPLESDGTDAILVAASIYAEADDTFDASTNDTDLVFATGLSETATEKMRLDSSGKLGLGTAIPAKLLDIHTGTTDEGIRLFSTATGGRTVAELQVENAGVGSAEFRLHSGTILTTRIFSNPSHDSYFNAGNIAIGCTAPSSLLDVRGAAGEAGILTLSTAETTVVDGDELGRINFSAPVEDSGTDAILVAASIYAEADDTFDASTNDTDLVFATGLSETATEKMRLDSGGVLNFPDNGKIALGTSSDLQLYHSSSNSISFIENTAAAGLRLLSDELRVFAQNGAAIRAHFGTDVELYYNDSKKFETTTDGISITGGIDLTGELNFLGGGNKNLDVETLASNNTFKIRHYNPSGNIFETAAAFTANAGAELYYNHTKKFETLTDGVKVTGAMALSETTTPTATADVGKVYTKSDNKLYFQDGAGTEHEIAFA